MRDIYMIDACYVLHAASYIDIWNCWAILVQHSADVVLESI